MKRALLLFCFSITSLILSAQTSISGTVTDEDNGDPLISATVALYKDGNLETGNFTDLDGNFYFANVDPGVYDVEVTYTGYQAKRVTDIQIYEGQSNRVDIQLGTGTGINLNEVVVIGFEEPLVEQDNTTVGNTVTSSEIRQLPTRNINALAATGAGIASTDEGGALNIRGSRSNATYYYVDGIRVQGNLIQESEIEQLQTVIGGVPAAYGDVTGGFISITTKGPSRRFGGSVELETSEFLDDFGQSLAGFSVSGPILRSARDKEKSLIGFRLAGRYTFREDNNPSAVPLFRVTDEKLAELEANPLSVINVNGEPRVFVAADFNDNSGVNSRTTRPFNEFSRGDINAKLDFQLTDGIDLQLTGYYGETEDQFTPGGWRVYNSHLNPTRFDTDYRFGARLRHRLGKQGLDASGEDLGVVQNASYVLQFGYENNRFDRSSLRHGDNLFAYGHVANFDVNYAVPVVGIDTTGNLFHAADRIVLEGYDDSNSSNPVLANYNNVYGIDDFRDENLYGIPFGFITDDQAEEIIGSTGIPIPTTSPAFIATNGSTQSQFTSSYNIHSNLGSVYNLFQFGDNDVFTFNASANLDIVPGGGNSTKNRHSVQFGIMYEQRSIRTYGVSPRGLWTVARQLANDHLDTPTSANRQIGEITIDASESPFGVGGTVPLYAPTVEENAGQFYRSVRERLGMPLDEYVNIDGLDPSQLSLDMFSARELNDAALLGYLGYDYLGNEFNGSFDDFFGEIDPATGLRGANTFNVAPYEPIYTAAFIQDKFTINDMIFRLGVRIDRFDANTKVLSDPYSPFKLLGAADFHEGAGTTRPGSIGDDYAVYLNSEQTRVVAYRNGDDWFNFDGTPVNGPQEIEAVRAGTSIPAFLNPEVAEQPNFIQSEDFEVDDSFVDYEVQVNVMPRLSFSFPISDASNFFAHYDVLVQRPASNNVATALDYYYFQDRAIGANNPINNPNLRPTTTIDYEVGFKQRLTPRSAITISAYYKEFRDMIQLRAFIGVPLIRGNSYTTYDNQDFGTTKGFNVTYDLRRTNNITINANYSLSFTDGTGSNTNTQRGLNNNGNIRALFPLDFDERHRINFIVDYRLDENTSIGLLKNAGLNIQSVAVSGRPFTATQRPSRFGGSSIAGGINGSRQPWTFTVNARLDKQINISDRMGLNIYFRVSNLFNRRNVVSVYTVTGSPEDPGWLQSRFGQDFLRDTESQTVPVDSFLAAYNWAVLNPGFFTQPRRMYLGTILSF